ncbi:DUF4349 domain-containing protein [Demequina globuliformis]|uniref:DUF4349 domain-containing protein n=1 Tax=Demequina globuliformis TaxID=676202 RepID=UPI000783B63E|nr:DUF4349 domain-containing protein [Demequina globuliformis]
MDTQNRTARRRRLAAGATVAAMVTAWALAGCSSSDSESDSAGDYGGSYEEGAGSAEASAMAPEIAYTDEDSAVADGEFTTERSVITTGAMYMTVDDPVEASDTAVAIVQDAGGRIDARSETAPDEWNGGSAFLTMRIPSDDLTDVVDQLRTLGTVDEFTTNAYDVSTEVTDLEAQISTLRASTERIEGLLDQAEDIEDIIALESELDSRRSELEALEARERGLADQVSMSTVDLSLTTEPIVEVDDDPDSFLSGLQSGWEGLLGFLSGALVVAGVLLPWLVVLAAVALVVLWVMRARRARRTAPEPEATQPSPPHTPPHTD